MNVNTLKNKEVYKMEIISWVLTHKTELIAGYFALVGLASIIVKLTPTVKDDHILKNILRFTGKFIALNRTEKKF